MTQTILPDSQTPQRKVGIFLGLMLWAMPYFSYWFLLRPGYSTTARVVGGVWLALVVGIIMSAVGEYNNIKDGTADPTQVTKPVAVEVSKYPAGWDDLIPLNFGEQNGATAATAILEFIHHAGLCPNMELSRPIQERMESECSVQTMANLGFRYDLGQHELPEQLIPKNDVTPLNIPVVDFVTHVTQLEKTLQRKHRMPNMNIFAGLIVEYQDNEKIVSCGDTYNKEKYSQGQGVATKNLQVCLLAEYRRSVTDKLLIPVSLSS